MLEAGRIQLELLCQIARGAASASGTWQDHVLDEGVGSSFRCDAVVEDEIGHMTRLRAYLLRQREGAGALLGEPPTRLVHQDGAQLHEYGRNLELRRES